MNSVIFQSRSSAPTMHRNSGMVPSVGLRVAEPSVLNMSGSVICLLLPHCNRFFVLAASVSVGEASIAERDVGVGRRRASHV